MPVSLTSLATRIVSRDAEPQPSGQGNEDGMYRAPRISMARSTSASRSRSSATVAVAT